MVPGQYSWLLVSMIEECRSFLCSKEDHTLQYVVLSNEVMLSPFLLILLSWLCLLFEDQGSVHCEFDITDAVVSDPERSVNTSSSWIFRLSISRWDKESAILSTFFFVFPGYTQMILHILQGLKASTKRVLKLLIHWRYCSYGL
jgi:hypothetical protein